MKNENGKLYAPGLRNTDHAQPTNLAGRDICLKPNMPAVDWTHEPISATSVYPPLAEAKRRIDAILSDLPPSTDDKQALT